MQFGACQRLATPRIVTDISEAIRSRFARPSFLRRTHAPLAEASHVAASQSLFAGESLCFHGNVVRCPPSAVPYLLESSACSCMSTRHVRGDDVTTPRSKIRSSRSKRHSRCRSAARQGHQAEGTGRQAFGTIQSRPGPGQLRISHDGESNLVVRLLDENGKEIDTVFNQIGPFQGDRLIPIRKRRPWPARRGCRRQLDVTIRQPQPTDVASCPSPCKALAITPRHS